VEFRGNPKLSQFLIFNNNLEGNMFYLRSKLIFGIMLVSLTSASAMQEDNTGRYTYTHENDGNGYLIIGRAHSSKKAREGEGPSEVLRTTQKNCMTNSASRDSLYSDGSDALSELSSGGVISDWTEEFETDTEEREFEKQKTMLKNDLEDIRDIVDYLSTNRRRRSLKNIKDSLHEIFKLIDFFRTKYSKLLSLNNSKYEKNLDGIEEIVTGMLINVHVGVLELNKGKIIRHSIPLDIKVFNKNLSKIKRIIEKEFGFVYNPIIKLKKCRVGSIYRIAAELNS
jgi:hypothetical protein